MVSTAATNSASLGILSSAASSPIPSTTPESRWPPPRLEKNRRISSNSPSSGSILMRAGFPRGSVQDRIDEFVAVGRAELFGQLHRLIESHSIRQFRMRQQLVKAEPERRMFNGIKLMRRDFAESG